MKVISIEEAKGIKDGRGTIRSPLLLAIWDASNKLKVGEALEIGYKEMPAGLSSGIGHFNKMHKATGKRFSMRRFFAGKKFFIKRTL